MTSHVHNRISELKNSPFPKKNIYTMLTPNFILVSNFIQVPRTAYVFCMYNTCCLEKYFQNNKDNNKKNPHQNIYFFNIVG